MKAHIFLLLFIGSLFCINVNATTTTSTSKKGTYKWIRPQVMRRCNLNGADSGAAGDTIAIGYPGQRFIVIDVRNGFAILKYIDFKLLRDNQQQTPEQSQQVVTSARNMSLQNIRRYNVVGLTDDATIVAQWEHATYDHSIYQLYFKVSIEDLDANAINNDKISGGLTLGVINFPFKYRPQSGKGDFSGSFNFGAAIGYKLPHYNSRKFNYSVLSGYSISNINADSSSVERNADKLKTTNNFTAFSFSLGVLVEYEKVQAGLFIGWDRLSRINHNEFGWIYQGAPWLSVGFGLSIFSTEKPADNTTSTQKQNN